jgi:hypothetical protein
METPHKLTDLERSLTKILKATFEQHGWMPAEFPEILDSNEEQRKISPDEWDYDNILGVYRRKSNWSQIGEVVLYSKNIATVAERFFDHDQLILDPTTGEYILGDGNKPTRKSDLLHFIVSSFNPDYGVTLEQAKEYLTAIVLVHELAHWQIHWWTDFNQKSLRADLKYNIQEEIDFHEALAQYATDYVLRAFGNQKMMDLFNFLKGKQSQPYRRFEELKTDKAGNSYSISSVYLALAICWFENFTQSFEALKNYTQQINEGFTDQDFHVLIDALKQGEKPKNQEKLSELFKFMDRNLFFVPYFTAAYLEQNKIRMVSKRYGL